MRKLLNWKYGFTLIELMIIMTIIAILVVLGIVAIQTARKASRDTIRRDVVKSVMMALEQYYVVNKKYPDPCPGTMCTGVTLTSLMWQTDFDPYLDDNLSDPTGGIIKKPGFPTSCTTIEDPDGDPCWRYEYTVQKDSIDQVIMKYDLWILTESKCPCKPYSPGGACSRPPIHNDMIIFEPSCIEIFSTEPLNYNLPE